MMKVKDTKAAMCGSHGKNGRHINGSQSDPLEWSVRHLFTEACKCVGSLSKCLESWSILTEIRMCLAGMVKT